MTAAPPGEAQCPSCAGMYEHDADCPLASLSIEVADRLGLEEALARAAEERAPERKADKGKADPRP